MITWRQSIERESCISLWLIFYSYLSVFNTVSIKVFPAVITLGDLRSSSSNRKRTGRGKYFPLLQSTRTGSGANPVSCTTGIGRSFLGVKRTGHEDDHTCLVSRLKMSGAIPLFTPPPTWFEGVSRDSFTFTRIWTSVLVHSQPSIKRVKGLFLRKNSGKAVKLVILV